MRELFGLLVLAAVVHILFVEVLTVNVVGNCSANTPKDQAICSCMKNNLRWGFDIEKALFAGQPVDLTAPFKMCTANAEVR